MKTFPSRSFGKDKSGKEIKRSFQLSWYEKYKWIHYDSLHDAAFCFTCMKAVNENLVTSTKAEDNFTKIGFTNWKKALEKGRGFDKHEQSESHKEATDRFIVIPKTTAGDIGELLSSSYCIDKFNSRKILLIILESIRYLARQSLSLRGNWMRDEKCEENSNFY